MSSLIPLNLDTSKLANELFDSAKTATKDYLKSDGPQRLKDNFLQETKDYSEKVAKLQVQLIRADDADKAQLRKTFDYIMAAMDVMIGRFEILFMRETVKLVKAVLKAVMETALRIASTLVL